MKLLESFIESKYRGSSLCEDFIFANDNFLAVFDGATDKTDARYDGMPGGKFAVETLARKLEDVASDISASECIRALSEELRRMIVEEGPEAAPSDSPSASVVIYSEARSEIWRVGDCSWAASGIAHIGRKPIDLIVGLARAALLQALLEAGHSVEELRASDRGREMVLPLLKEQYRFRNLKEPTCDLGFGAIDGQNRTRPFHRGRSRQARRRGRTGDGWLPETATDATRDGEGLGPRPAQRSAPDRTTQSDQGGRARPGLVRRQSFSAVSRLGPGQISAEHRHRGQRPAGEDQVDADEEADRPVGAAGELGEDEDRRSGGRRRR